MPVTPLHLGPGALVKAAAGKHMSLIVFAFAQFAMDLEVLARILMGAEQLHGFSNTVMGATVVLFPTVLLGRPLCRLLLRWWNSRLSAGQAVWLSVGPEISWKAAWAAGIFGVYSHVILDAVMHWDARPWVTFVCGRWGSGSRFWWGRVPGIGER